MINTAKELEVNLRPHMKTHKTLEIGEMMAPSKSKISVSTLAELEFFADGGFDDILLAIPITQDKLERVKSVHGRKNISILVNTLEILDCLDFSDRPWVGYQKIAITIMCQRTYLSKWAQDMNELESTLKSTKKSLKFLERFSLRPTDLRSMASTITVGIHTWRRKREMKQKGRRSKRWIKKQYQNLPSWGTIWRVSLIILLIFSPGKNKTIEGLILIKNRIHTRMWISSWWVQTTWWASSRKLLLLRLLSRDSRKLQAIWYSCFRPIKSEFSIWKVHRYRCWLSCDF